MCVGIKKKGHVHFEREKKKKNGNVMWHAIGKYCRSPRKILIVNHKMEKSHEYRFSCQKEILSNPQNLKRFEIEKCSCASYKYVIEKYSCALYKI